MTSRSSSLLRWALVADAAVSGLAGLLMIIGAGYLGTLLGVPDPLLRIVGVCLLLYAAVLAYLASRESLPRAAVWGVIGCNVFWTLDSFLLLLSGWINPTALGQVLIAVQAVAVAIFAGIQYLGLQRSTGARRLQPSEAPPLG
jgi:hypothetical protein